MPQAQAAAAAVVPAAAATLRRVSSGDVGSRRRTTADAPPARAAAAGLSAGGAGARAGGACGSLVRRFHATPVEAPAIVEVQLDGGKPLKLDKLLELSPWLAAQQARLPLGRGFGAAPQPPPSTAAGAKGSAPTVAGGKKKAKGSRVHRRLAFTVRAAAVVSAEEPTALPARLLRWAVASMQRRGADDNWRLRLVELLQPDWLLSCEQVCCQQ